MRKNNHHEFSGNIEADLSPRCSLKLVVLIFVSQGNAVLRKLLPGLEGSHGGLSTHNKVSSHLSELQRIATSYKVCSSICKLW